MQQDLFNDYIVHFGDRMNNISRMICRCLPECDYYIYNTQFSNVPLRNATNIMLDVHYMGQTSFRYKTDMVITGMDLLGEVPSPLYNFLKYAFLYRECLSYTYMFLVRTK